MTVPVRVLSGLGITLGCAALLVGLVAGEGALHLARSHGGYASVLATDSSPLLTGVAFASALLLGVAGVACLYAAARTYASRATAGAATAARDETQQRAVTL